MTHDNSIPNSDIALSLDVTETRRKTLADLIPEAFSEGRLDISALKRALGESSLIDGGERYRLDWAGKSDAYKVLQTPSSATLRPQPELSINFDAAQHIFIEGENLEVLKVLQKAYFGKVKLIYIDPPYNTGSDSFIYPDRYQESKEEYLKRINDLTDDGTLMREGFFRKNNRENGQFHSNWLSMMLPRLYIARNLLRDDGVILVSIDDNEAANLKLLMDEVFGPENFVAQLVWEKGRKNDAKLFSVGHEYMFVYARSVVVLKDNETIWREPKPGAKEIFEKWRELKNIHEDNYSIIQQELRTWYASLPHNHPSRKLSRYKWVDKWGPWRDRDISWPGGGGPRYNVVHPKTHLPCKVPERGWIFSSHEEMQRQIKSGLVVFRDDHTEPPFRKAHLLPVPEELNTEAEIDLDYAEEDDDDEAVGLQVMPSVIYKQSQVSVKYLRNLLDGKVFDNPKDYEVLMRLINYCLGNESTAYIMDFFSGSCSTIEAALRLNQRDDLEIKTIAVQLPEHCDDTSQASKAGYKTIADIGRERIRRVIEKIKTEADLEKPVPSTLGVKCFQLTPSNFKQWRGDGIETANELAEQIEMFVDSVKSGAKTDDLLFELLLKFGQPLTTPIEWLDIEGQRIAAIHNRSLLFILEGFSFEMIEQLLALKPKEIIALDRVFAKSDELQSNLDLACRDVEVKFTCI